MSNASAAADSTETVTKTHDSAVSHPGTSIITVS
jgi:hypothetical protein